MCGNKHINTVMYIIYTQYYQYCYYSCVCVDCNVTRTIDGIRIHAHASRVIKQEAIHESLSSVCSMNMFVSLRVFVASPES